jgi:hypothetical protein
MHPYSDPAMSRRSLLVRAGTGAAGVGCGLLLAACGQAAVSDVLHALRPQLQSQVAKGMPA